MNEFGCNLIIDTGSDNPNVITEITGINSSEILIKGMPYINSLGEEIPQKINQYNLWIYKGIQLIEKDGVYLNTSLEGIYNILNSNRKKFEHVFSCYEKKHILCFGYYKDYHQYFVLNKELINLMSIFNLDIEFDIYFLEE